MRQTILLSLIIPVAMSFTEVANAELFKQESKFGHGPRDTRIVPWPTKALCSL